MDSNQLKRESKGYFVPAHIWRNNKLSWNAKAILAMIESFTVKDEDCYFSNEYFAQSLGITIFQVSRILSELKELGYIKQIRFDGRKRYLRSCLISQADKGEVKSQVIDIASKNEQNGIKGIFIPAVIWNNRQISLGAKILFMEIDSFIRKGRACFVSNEYVANFLNVSPIQAQRILGELKKRGWIKTVEFDGRKRYITTCFDYEKMFDKRRTTENQDIKGDLSKMSQQHKNDMADLPFMMTKPLQSSEGSPNKHDDYTYSTTKLTTYSSSSSSSNSREQKESVSGSPQPPSFKDINGNMKKRENEFTELVLVAWKRAKQRYPSKMVEDFLYYYKQCDAFELKNEPEKALMRFEKIRRDKGMFNITAKMALWWKNCTEEERNNYWLIDEWRGLGKRPKK